MYAQNKAYNKTLWKQEVRKKVRSGILKYLRDNFKFYQIMIQDKDIEDFVERHYRKITGKVFAFEDILGKRFYCMLKELLSQTVMAKVILMTKK